MKYESLYDGKKLPVVGLGTWKIGGEMTADYSHDDEAIDIIRKAIKMGYSHIDTAQMYGGGHTEELVGRAIRPLKREDLLITTKVWSNNLRYGDVLHEFDTRRLFHHPGLKRIADESNATLAQIAIHWLIRKPKVITIPMSSKEDHLRENLEAVDLKLSVEILESLDRLVPV